MAAMRVIDDEGFVFGLLNIIDVLVVLLVLAVATAGLALVTASNDTGTQSVTVQTTPQPDYVVAAIEVGPVPTDEVIAVKGKAVSQVDNGRFVAVLEVKLRVSLQGNVPMFQDERLYIGRTLTIDFGRTVVDGTVIDMARTSGGD